MNFHGDSLKANTKLPKVMRAALKLFVKNGIDGTTIKDIAKAAGVAEGALYRHYKSKDDLAWDLFQSNLSQFTTELMRKVLVEKTAKARIERFVSETFQAYEEDSELFAYLILLEHSELKSYSQAQLMHPGHLAMQIIEDGQKSGEIKAGEIYVLASMFVGAIIRMCVVRMYGNLKAPLQTNLDAVSDSLWLMLQNPGGAS